MRLRRADRVHPEMELEQVHSVLPLAHDQDEKAQSVLQGIQTKACFVLLRYKLFSLYFHKEDATSYGITGIIGSRVGDCNENAYG